MTQVCGRALHGAAGAGWSRAPVGGEGGGYNAELHQRVVEGLPRRGFGLVSEVAGARRRRDRSTRR